MIKHPTPLCPPMPHQSTPSYLRSRSLLSASYQDHLWPFSSKLSTLPGGWLGLIIIRLEANSVRLNLPTGTDLGNKKCSDCSRIYSLDSYQQISRALALVQGVSWKLSKSICLLLRLENKL